MLSKIFIGIFALTCVAAQGYPNIQPKCAGKGTVVADDCNLALAQFNRTGDFITDCTPKSLSSCSSCQVVLQATGHGNLNISFDSAKQSLQAILEGCHCGYGSIQFPCSDGIQANLTVMAGNGNMCPAPCPPASEPQYDSAAKSNLSGIMKAVLLAPVTLLMYFS